MTVKSRDPRLLRLVAAARSALAAVQNPDIKVAAAVLSGDDQIFTGVQVRSRSCGHCSTCAEPVALGAALAVSTHDLEACVAVVRTDSGIDVWSPCGTCRELLRDLKITTVIVAEHDGAITTATPEKLLPWA
ncbi:hypothetical protein SMC26_23930 [Actinomadura fulvescens]|uniref:CMP/dCMP-type deaminase domain-containing protein n=1 Tax=Actinomadura fulvescens TaxID=46160 RepID=A0ABP6CFW0_9ACTN